ncbi:MAG: hypothetical protein QXP02_00715 [Desulfurococcaceae archaeon]
MIYTHVYEKVIIDHGSNIVTYFIASGTVTTITQLSTITSPITVISTIIIRETTTTTVTQTTPSTPTPTPTPTTTPAYPAPPPPPSTEEILKAFPETVIIDQWDGLTGGDGYVYDDIVYMFQNYTQGRIQVRRTTVYWADLFARLVATWRAGDIESLPHLLLTHTEEIPLMKPFLAPLDNLVREIGFRKEMFDPISWGRCVWDGKVLCLPWDIHPLLIYFRVDLAQKYGIKIPPPACEVYNLPCWDRPLDTLDDLWAWYKNEVKPKLPADIIPAGQQSWAWDMWGLFPKNPWAGKGTDDNPQPEFTADYVVKVLRFFYDISVNGIWKIVPWSDLANCLAGGQIFSWYNGPWMMASFDIIEGGCPYGAIPLLRKEGGTFGQLHNLEITVRATRDPKVMQAIKVFFQYIF